ncbi:MAG: hypothetical protein JNL11_08455 [Bdellovibrionaceae bacterium]|nr:hypothetical protein [Pseudobdellovibrionaceae bacterium]
MSKLSNAGKTHQVDSRLNPDSTQINQLFHISTFYHFFPLTDLDAVKVDLCKIAEKHKTLGLVIIGPEGLNSTVAADSAEALMQFKKELQDHFQIQIENFKDSFSDAPPFRRFSTKIRDEIVTAGLPGRSPEPGINHHLSPEEWDHVLKNEKDFVLIDTRNWYEYKIGTFKGAINPNIEKFTEFPAFFESQHIPKEKKILIFCTGGIRCEKGILELQDKGYDNVFQLNGGILKYMAEKPRQEFEGECFVFDNRVAVNADLQPSQVYKLCPHCGQPAHIKIECKRCDEPALLCESCLELEWKKDTCSKNCSYQYSINPHKKGKHQVQHYEAARLKK